MVNLRPEDVYTLGRPTAILAPYIENYWFVFTPPGASMDLSVDVFADARVDLVFNMGSAYTRIALKRAAVLRHSNLDAQRIHPITIRQRGRVIVAGVRFRTAGLAAFVGSSVHAWTDRVVPIATVFGRDVVRLQRALYDSIGDAKTQTELLDAYFTTRLDVTDAKKTLWSLKSKIETERGLVRIDTLCDDFDISIRQLDRLFRQHLGVPPKTFAQITRFQTAIGMLKSDPGGTLADVAARCGYYDQSHFVHEFRRFAGAAPNQKRGFFPAGAPKDFSPNLVQFFQDSSPK
jgi:AraC-like DNA-binding protein